MAENSKTGSVQDENGPISVHRIKEKAMEGLGGALRDMIPSDDVKAYHPKYFFPLASAICFGMLAVFIALFIPTFMNELGNQYLSPTGADEPADCDSVPVSHSGTFYATHGGYWAGSDRYCYSNTTYSLSLSNRLYSAASYEQDMAEIYKYLQDYGNRSASYGLGVILTFWMSFVILPDVKNAAQRFTLFADPRNIFNREKSMGSVGSNRGLCLTNSSSTDFHISSGRLSLSMKVNELEEDASCSDSIRPALFGYEEAIDRNKVVLGIDIRALVTSFAVNIQVMEMPEVEEIVGSRSTISLPTATLGIANYYDPSYPGMQYITCLTAYSNPLCIVQMGNVVALPFFQHVGNSTDWPIPCNCSDPNIGDLSDETHPCHRFTLMAALLYYDNGTAASIFELVERYNMTEIAERSYLAMFLSSAFAASSSRKDELYSNATVHKAFDWCHSDTYGDCNFLVFSAWDETRVDFTVNQYYYQLRHGACRNTLATTPVKWQRLVDTPFSTLTEDYVVCQQTLYNSVINSVGVASGNLSLLTPFIIIFFLLVAGMYQRCTGSRWPQGYHPDEKGEILDDLATILLLLRDNRLATTSIDSSSQAVQKLQVAKLSKELGVLSRQLVKQYEEGPKEEDEVDEDLNCCLSLCPLSSKREGRKSANREDGLETDTIETHYGHYNVLPRGVLVETEGEGEGEGEESLV